MMLMEGNQVIPVNRHQQIKENTTTTTTVLNVKWFHMYANGPLEVLDMGFECGI